LQLPVDVGQGFGGAKGGVVFLGLVLVVLLGAVVVHFGTLIIHLVGAVGELSVIDNDDLENVIVMVIGNPGWRNKDGEDVFGQAKKCSVDWPGLAGRYRHESPFQHLSKNNLEDRTSCVLASCSCPLNPIDLTHMPHELTNIRSNGNNHRMLIQHINV